MGGVLTKRLQQGIFEALASQNRAAGSGGGSGLRGLSAQTNSGGFVGGLTNAGWTTITSVTVNITHPSDVLVWANMAFNRTVGVGPDTFFAELQRDSDADWITGLGMIDGGTSYQDADAGTRALFMLKAYNGQLVGNHTFNLKAKPNGDTFQAQGSITVLVLGG